MHIQVMKLLYKRFVQLEFSQHIGSSSVVLWMIPQDYETQLCVLKLMSLEESRRIKDRT